MRSAPSILPAAFLAVLLSACVAPAHGRGHRVVVVRERPYTRVVVRGSPGGGASFWYHEGYYYRRHHGRYLLMDAPRGVVIRTLPVGFVRLHFGPSLYYYSSGVYYQEAPEGYVVVDKPDTVFVEKKESAADEKFSEPVSKTVTIQNTNDSKTPVRLEQMEDGKWKGPRGEIYDSFPSDDQLRQAYGF